MLASPCNYPAPWFSDVAFNLSRPADSLTKQKRPPGHRTTVAGGPGEMARNASISGRRGSALTQPATQAVLFSSPDDVRGYYTVADKILKVMLSVQGERNIFECSAIEHEGALWLVPRWLPTQGDGYAMPERLIRFDQFAYQTLAKPRDPADYAINVPIPKDDLFEGPISPQLKAQFVVLDRPNIRHRTGSTLH